MSERDEPDLAELLRDWSLAGCPHAHWSDERACSPCMRNQLLASPWLRKDRAEKWDEGHADGRHNEHEYRPGRQITNPYRDEVTGDDDA
jgi:hypothetical protein